MFLGTETRSAQRAQAGAGRSGASRSLGTGDQSRVSAAVRCEELIGKYRGMFIDRHVADVAISSEPSVVDILRARRARREAQRKTDADNPTLLT
jgi:hypothetical protein